MIDVTTLILNCHFPILDGDVPRSTSYGVYISQLIRFANINVLQQTACLVVNPIMVGNFAFLFNCRLVGRIQTLRRFRLKDLSIDELVGA